MTEGGGSYSALADHVSSHKQELARFGHHPDPVTDFCVEVEALEAEAADLRAGLKPTMDLDARIFRAMTFTASVDPHAIAAKTALRALEASHKQGDALTFTANQARALLEMFGGEPGEVTVVMRGAGEVAADEDGSPSPAGLYGHMTEYPGEGCNYLGAPDEDAKPEQGAALQEPCRPDILEKLTYHQHERDDMSIDDLLEVLASGYRKVHGRTERQMQLQLLALLAATPPRHKEQG